MAAAAPPPPLDEFVVRIGRDPDGWFVAEVEGLGDVPGTMIRDTDPASLRTTIGQEIERRMRAWPEHEARSE
jgi:hypothetical protein